ncbi:a-factor receptor [Cadophora gregata]|uniref:a-factor receptor n=1 Tax=Cadophora gregata TaxID=51156 RepID=UPI0026DBA6C2|nr:a-factor receptor [Cadophora gregata]KAK0100409.1 a-factor receptor [Cadophora gregata f. sp. sojae]KAK0126779.1 a-factor receptor [Cadophora gregata]
MQNTDVAPSVTIEVTDFVMPDEVANPVNAVALPLFAALALLITYLPLRSFYRVKNIAACSMMAVIVIINLMAFINGILWPSDDWTKWWEGYGLCDVEAILRFPITMALATSLCCLTKGLADALDTECAVFNPSKSQRRRKVIGDVLFCWLLPVMMMALHYTIQAGRYMIIPVWGCADQLDNSWPMLVIIIMWCPIFTLLNVYYAAIMFYRLYRHRKTISATLTSTGSGLAPRKFIKLVLISVLLIVIYLPIQALFTFYAIPTKFVPYSWSRIHNPVTWSPILFIHTGMQPSLQWAGWAGVVASVFMFAFFGFNDDAVDTYRAALVNCGAGRIWPSLKLSRDERRASETLVNTTGSKSSFKSQLDLVGKAMKYFDTESRTDSHATGSTLTDRTTTTISRKGSQGTFSNATDNLSHIPTSTSTNASLLHKSAASHDSDHQMYSNIFSQNGQVDDITPAPSQFRYEDSSISPTCFNSLQTPAQTPSSTTPLQSSLHRGVFSMFRTHMNLPFSAFASSKPASKVKPTSKSREQAEMSIITSRHDQATTNKEADLEAQGPTAKSFPIAWPRRTSATPSHTTVSTNIWSPGSTSGTPSSSSQQPKTSTVSHTLAHSPKLFIATIDNDEGFFDPHSPKMGTRAYRERERREFAASVSTASKITLPVSTSPRKELQTRIYADNVHQELGMQILAPTETIEGGRKEGKKSDQGMRGVIVTKSLDIKEERTG